MWRDIYDVIKDELLSIPAQSEAPLALGATVARLLIWIYGIYFRQFPLLISRRMWPRRPSYGFRPLNSLGIGSSGSTAILPSGTKFQDAKKVRAAVSRKAARVLRARLLLVRRHPSHHTSQAPSCFFVAPVLAPQSVARSAKIRIQLGKTSVQESLLDVAPARSTCQRFPALCCLRNPGFHEDAAGADTGADIPPQSGRARTSVTLFQAVHGRCASKRMLTDSGPARTNAHAHVSGNPPPPLA